MSTNYSSTLIKRIIKIFTRKIILHHNSRHYPDKKTNPIWSLNSNSNSKGILNTIEELIF